jgi:hypothetical protein
MPRRWRGRSVGLAITLLAVVLSTGRASTVGSTGPALLVQEPDGGVLAVVPLTDGQFTLRYRNSIYGTLAEEHYAVMPDGSMVLVGLAAEQLAVLEEYSDIDGPARPTNDGPMRWEADPARPLAIDELVVAATDRGERTLIVRGGRPLPLTAFVEDREPSVRIEAGTR